MKNILFILIFLILSGCQSQEKTDFEIGYQAGEKDMKRTFWRLLDAETDLWIAWENQAVINREEGQKMKMWGMITSAFGLFTFLGASVFAEREISKIKKDKEKSEKEVFKLIDEVAEAKKTIALAKKAKSEQQLMEASISDLYDEKERLEREIEALLNAKSKAESDFDLAKEKLDEISI